MTHLILTSDSGAGALRAAGLADLVIGIGARFVAGPLPSAQALAELLSPRAEGASGPHWLDHLRVSRLDQLGWQRAGLVDLCEWCETVELWVDPLPNAQLQAIWLLDHLGSRIPGAVRLTLRQADAVIGDRAPEELVAWRVPSIEIEDDQFRTAALAWQAYCEPTPQAWAQLLGRDLAPLPQLRSTVLELLGELPRPRTGIGETETRLLQLVADGFVHPFDLFPGYEKPNRGRVFEYWETGALLDGLAHSPAPALTGLAEGPFTLEMHDDRDRLQRYKASCLSLTPLGEAILAGEDDFSRHNPIHRWWGGTELTNANLWRWDPVANVLIAP
ncbi:conserved hypothetical protein [Bradyrhizobium sp. STM 3843]|uniref:hypothetical protein n=1 Tax=Bradyrhizobium sp. STM 3843 TaxID=551947 RepID=UPI0002403D0C|nr:hypothetical protein [Bradyrhizobium sp. STM 3843]CCE09123.1 conserved hypothetical protein [Bradyrhizobium sp. STM 3843]